MRLMGRYCLQSCFYVLLIVLALGTMINQKPSYGGIKPGVYDVTIKTSPVENGHDTWIFSVDGKFESERLGIKSEWQDTGNNTFKIKTDKKEIKARIIENLNSLGLKNSDFSISIKEIELKGTTLENKIRGEIKTDFHISIKRPVKAGFSTSSSVNFVGKAAPSNKFDGTYTGSWSVTCPGCNDTAAGAFTTTLANWVFTNTQFTITSGTHGPHIDSGTVSPSGAITGTGNAPSQCSSSVSTFTGQITLASSGSAGMTMTYSRPASPEGWCGAEFGTITATRQ